MDKKREKEYELGERWQLKHLINVFVNFRYVIDKI